MKRIGYLLLVFVLSYLVSCSGGSIVQSTPTMTVEPTLAPVGISTTKVPDIKVAAKAYLDAWKADDYAAMYAMLTSISQDAITAEDFEKYYRGVATEAAMQELNYEILSALVLSPEAAQISYRVILNSALKKLIGV